MSGTWVFGYGSLVSPPSLASTIGRPVDRHDLVVGHLSGFGRRWNYGSMHLRGDWHHDGVTVRGGLVVSLGVVVAADEECNGVAVRVSDDELSKLDWRERDYERTDVTDAAVAYGPADFAGDRVVTYVPRPSAIERYERARDERRAAIRRSYWDLVIAAFADLGDDHARRYAATPAPDVPVADISLSLLG
jgi:cation transport regulator ChaC